MKEFALHHAGFEKAVDELKEAAISYPFGQQVEQSGLMDTIERDIKLMPPSRTQIKPSPPKSK